MKPLILVLATFLSLQTHALQPFNARCLAYGDRVGGNDMGAFVADAVLALWIIGESAGVVTATITGNIKVSSRAVHEIETPEQLNPGNAYIGDFAAERIQSNAEYRPRKYVGYTQFRNLNAIETWGLESGMCGSFLIGPEYATADRFHGVYVFQAGDHMGGTLHFECTAR